MNKLIRDKNYTIMKIIKWDREIYKIMINTTIGKIKKNY